IHRAEAPMASEATAATPAPSTGAHHRWPQLTIGNSEVSCRVPICFPSAEGGHEAMKGSIRQQGKRSWEVRVYLGRGPDGRRLYRSHTVTGTKRQAQNELNDLLSKLQRGEYVAPSRMTVAEYLDRWLRDYAAVKVAAKT